MTAAFLRGVSRVLWKELFELRQKPSVAFLVLGASLVLVWVSGRIDVEQPRVGLVLFAGQASEAEVEEVRELLREFAHLTVTTSGAGDVDTTEVERAGASLAVVRMSGRWVVRHRLATARQEEDASRLALLISDSLEKKRPLSALLIGCGGDAESTADGCGDGVTGFTARMAALPGEPGLRLVPRTIALIVVFLPFVLATRSYGRDVASGMVPILLGLPDSGWATIVVGKIASCLLTVGVVFLLLLVAIDPMFGLSPKPGLLPQFGAQALAMLVSASVGLIVAMLARNQSHLHLAIALYFLALVLVSGFLFPLDTASPVIRWASGASPLTFSGEVLERWLLFGTKAWTLPRHFMSLAAQAGGAFVLMSVTIAMVRRRV